MSDIIEVLKHNKPLQCYSASNASDKLAQQVASQAIINTLFNGILIGNMGPVSYTHLDVYKRQYWNRSAKGSAPHRESWRGCP